MHVIDVPLKIQFIPDHMLPKMTLPDASFPGCLTITDSDSVLGKAREKPLLIKRQRKLKSLSPGGNVNTQCICSAALPTHRYGKDGVAAPAVPLVVKIRSRVLAGHCRFAAVNLP